MSSGRLSLDSPVEHLPVHQIWFSERKLSGLPENAAAIARAAGRDRYRLWQLGESRDFLAEHLGASAVKAFDTLIPYAYKADLFRYCVVYVLGGHYLDMSVSDAKLFDPADRDFVGFRDPNSDMTSWKVANHFFFARKASPILRRAIDEVIRNVADRYYGKDPHFPTGPSVLGQSVAATSPGLDVLLGQYWWLKRRRNKYVLPGHGVVGRGKVGGKYLGGISGVDGGNDYNELWHSHQVYFEPRD